MLKVILSQASMKRKVQRLDTVRLMTEVYGEGIVQTTNGHAGGESHSSKKIP